MMNDLQLDDLRQLILDTDVLNATEKQYWLDLLPTMNEQQKNQLKNILETQQKNVEAINKKYDQKLEQVAQKYFTRWDSEKAKETRSKRRKEELSHQEESEQKADELLSQFE